MVKSIKNLVQYHRNENIILFSKIKNRYHFGAINRHYIIKPRVGWINCDAYYWMGVG